MSRTLVVVDLGVGNIFSLCAAFDYLGAQYVVSSRAQDIDAATHIVLPGVGAFDPAIAKLDELGLRSVLHEQISVYLKPVLGICLGMQLLFERSEEGSLAGLGVVHGQVTRLSVKEGQAIKVPHVGFAELYDFEERGLFAGLGTAPSFYFTHSYAAANVDPSFNRALCVHGSPFVAGFQADNICGVQFHPEKSQSSGLRLLSNFAELGCGDR